MQGKGAGRLPRGARAAEGAARAREPGRPALVALLAERELDAPARDEPRERALPDRLHRHERRLRRRRPTSACSSPTSATSSRPASRCAGSSAARRARLLGDVAGAAARAGRLRGRARERARARGAGARRLAAGVELRRRPAACVEELRAVKDAGEVDAIRAAAELADAAYEELRERGLAGRTEREVARSSSSASMRGPRGGGAVVPPIVAAGAHGALPHAEPRDVAIPRGHARGASTGRRRRRLLLGLHAHVRDGRARRPARGGLRAGAAAHSRRRSTAVRAGAVTAGRWTRVARATDRGRGPRRPLRPRARPRRRARGARGAAAVADAPRASCVAGNVVTVEPGVYVPGAFGVRIEDLVVVTDDGAEVLTRVPEGARDGRRLMAAGRRSPPWSAPSCSRPRAWGSRWCSHRRCSR